MFSKKTRKRIKACGDDVEATLEVFNTMPEKDKLVYAKMIESLNIPPLTQEEKDGITEKFKAEFSTEHCMMCGTQRCHGIYDEDYGEACGTLIEVIRGEYNENKGK